MEKVNLVFLCSQSKLMTSIRSLPYGIEARTFPHQSQQFQRKQFKRKQHWFPQYICCCVYDIIPLVLCDNSCLISAKAETYPGSCVGPQDSRALASLCTAGARPASPFLRARGAPWNHSSSTHSKHYWTAGSQNTAKEQEKQQQTLVWTLIREDTNSNI